MYVHKRCVLDEQELDYKRKTHGYCGICGNQGTVYHVLGTEDSYKRKRQGVTYTVLGGIEQTANTTEGLVFDEIAPVEVEVEAESTGENEALAEVIEEAVEAEIEAAVPEEEEPDKTPLEAEPEVPLEDSPDSSETVENGSAPKSSEESGIEPPPEAESEASGPTQTDALYNAYVGLKEAKEAEIARLEAELARLRPKE